MNLFTGTLTGDQSEIELILHTIRRDKQKHRKTSLAARQEREKGDGLVTRLLKNPPVFGQGSREGQLTFRSNSKNTLKALRKHRKRTASSKSNAHAASHSAIPHPAGTSDETQKGSEIKMNKNKASSSRSSSPEKDKSDKKRGKNSKKSSQKGKSGKIKLKIKLLCLRLRKKHYP